jgi:TPR repeat protein
MNRAYLFLLAPVLALSAVSAHGQTISQDYARYAGMLNQERADSAKRDNQSMIDSSSPRNGGGSGSSSGGGGSSSSGGTTTPESIGMLAGTLGTMMDRHNAAVAARQQRDRDAQARYARQTAENNKASTDFIAAYEKAHPAIQTNLAAAAQGDLKALATAGFQYLEGEGVAKDTAKGVSLMTDAANRGDAYSIHLLGMMYYSGTEGVEVDRTKAYYWHVKDAEAGNKRALAALCRMAGTGSGTPLDVATVERWCIPATANGDIAAPKVLGYLYSGAIPPMKPDRAKAVRYYRMAIERGDEPAYENLADVLSGGDGLPPDPEALLALYQSPAARNNVTAQLELGIRYVNGQGVDKDVVKGAALIQKAADQMSPRALEELADLTELGKGVPKDAAKALKLHQQAAIAGWGPALYNMGMMHMNGEQVQQDQIEGIKLLRLAADNGDRNAPGVLAQIYDEGYGVDKDPAEAKKWLKLGADRGDKKCIDKLTKS